MSQISLVTELQSELDALSRRRKSLESDVSNLDQKINAVNQNLQKNSQKEKMMSLIDTLETEKQRIQEKKLDKVNEKTKIIMDKISSIKNRRKDSILSNNIDKKSPRPTSMQLGTKPHDHASRKYQSLSSARPCTSNGIRLSSVQSNQQKEELSGHQPTCMMCMSTKSCKKCSGLRDFMLKIKHEKEVEEMQKTSPEKSCEDTINDKSDSTYSIKNKSEVLKVDILSNTYDSTKPSNENVSTANLNQIQYCMRCKALINDKTRGTIQAYESSVHSTKLQSNYDSQISQENSILSSLSIGGNSVISASILATCESYAFCECCNNNLLKISMPTPSPSIVEIGCKSHENCTKCTEALLSSRNNSISQPKLVVNPNATHNIGSKIPLKDDTLIYSKEMLCEEIEREIELQNQVIFDTKDQISKIATLKESDEKLFQLRSMLDIENLKLADMKNLLKIKEQKSEDVNLYQKSVLAENV